MYSENYTILLREIHGDLHKWRDMYNVHGLADLVLLRC